jgi:hypothetical protein
MFAAAWHELSQPDVFAGALADYRVLPERAVAPVARTLPIVEVALGAGILVPLTRTFALWGLAGLMLVYALAMGINLARGRNNIDCGCGGATHPLSWALVARNAVLAAAALLANRPAVERVMSWFDALTLILGVLALYALYLMADELLRQASRLAQLERMERAP